MAAADQDAGSSIAARAKEASLVAQSFYRVQPGRTEGWNQTAPYPDHKQHAEQTATHPDKCRDQLRVGQTLNRDDAEVRRSG